MDHDKAYNNVDHIPGGASYPDRWAEQAAAFRDRLEAEGRARLAVPYGPGEREAMDVFWPEREQGPRGLVVFVHGGYWLKFDRSYWSHFAQGPLERGWAVAMPSYDLCPEVRIEDITGEIARAVGIAASLVEGPIRLTGHSAGGHLVARMLAPGVLPEDVAERVKKVVPISPVSDLRPLLKTSMNDQFRMTEADAEAESPVLQPKPGVPVTVWVGAAERAVFLDQARWLAEAWDAPWEAARDQHHFNVIDGLKAPDSPLTEALLA